MDKTEIIEPSRKASRARPATRSLPVLVIDDNEADRKLTIAMLAHAWPFERD